MGMELNGRAIRYAVEIGRRMGMSEIDIRYMVHAALVLGGSLEGSPYSGGARILAVVGVFEALLLFGREKEEVLTHIKRRSGTHFDPNVVDAFLSLIREDATASLLGDRRVRTA